LGQPHRRSNFGRRALRPATDGTGYLGAPPVRLEPVKSGLAFHGLRHSHKTWMIADVVPEVAQSRRLGHILGDRIQETYSHVAAEVETRLLNADPGGRRLHRFTRRVHRLVFHSHLGHRHLRLPGARLRQYQEKDSRCIAGDRRTPRHGLRLLASVLAIACLVALNGTAAPLDLGGPARAGRSIGRARAAGRRDQGPVSDGCRTQRRRAQPRPLSRALEASLRRLQVDHIDLYQAHAWDPLTRIEETLAFFDDALRAGKIRYAGVSNFVGWQLQKAALRAGFRHLAPIVTLQPQYNLLVRDVEFELVDVS
jgi:Aldo/keto reductase family